MTSRHVTSSDVISLPSQYKPSFDAPSPRPSLSRRKPTSLGFASLPQQHAQPVSKQHKEQARQQVVQRPGRQRAPQRRLEQAERRGGGALPPPNPAKQLLVLRGPAGVDGRQQQRRGRPGVSCGFFVKYDRWCCDVGVRDFPSRACVCVFRPATRQGLREKNQGPPCCPAFFVSADMCILPGLSSPSCRTISKAERRKKRKKRLSRPRELHPTFTPRLDPLLSTLSCPLRRGLKSNPH